MSVVARNPCGVLARFECRPRQVHASVKEEFSSPASEASAAITLEYSQPVTCEGQNYDSRLQHREEAYVNRHHCWSRPSCMQI